ncbi:MAG: integrase [Marinilabiliales bacterium]|nr:MAG: integrase [Marinilabiliales bacterium]
METCATFEEYLFNAGHTEQTVKSYLYTIDIFLSICKNADKFKYKDIVQYFEQEGKRLDNYGSRSRVLSAIKKYYDYLIDAGKRNDHPCRNLYLKGQQTKGVIIHDLFSGSELEQLLDREERYGDLRIRNKLTMSILIYQGLSSGELKDINLRHINLDNGIIYIPESRKQSRRHLAMEPKQYALFDRYISEVRPKLIRNETNALLLGKLGSRLTIDDINYLVSTYKILFPGRNLNPRTIRQSVIANWLNEKKIPLEQVQLMAGHRWISSTAEYRFTSDEERREIINKYHPLEQFQ